jgi:hypothetical protein
MDHRKLRVDHRQPKFGSGVGTLLSDAHLTGRSGIVSTRSLKRQPSRQLKSPTMTIDRVPPLQQRDNEVFTDPTVD